MTDASSGATLSIQERLAADGFQDGPFPFQQALESREYSFSRSTDDGAYRDGLTLFDTLGSDPDWSFTRASVAYLTTDSGVLVSFAANEPRITDDGILIEPARTNLVLQSQTLADAAWTKARTVVTANATSAPDETVTADKFGSTGDPTPTVQQAVTLVDGVYTFSTYAKMAERQYLVVNLQTKGFDNYTYFDLQNGVVGHSSGDSTPAIQALANGWYRCTITRPSTAGSRWIALYHSSADGSITTPTAGEGIYIWGSQIEAAPDASSYIATAVTTVERPADLATTAFAPAATGFMFLEFQAPGILGVDPIPALGADVGTPLALLNGQSVTNNGVTDLTASTSVAAGQIVRACLTWGPGRRALSAQGLLASDAAGIGAITRLDLGGAGGMLNSWVRTVRLGETELTEAQLVNMTSARHVVTKLQVIDVPAATTQSTWALNADFSGQTRVRLGQQGVNDYSAGSGIVEVINGTNDGGAQFTRYQYGTTIRTWGVGSQILELFLNDDPGGVADFSVRGNGALGGSRINARDGADNYSVLLAATGSARGRMGLDGGPDELMIQHFNPTGYFTFTTDVDDDGEGGTEWMRLGPDGLRIRSLTAEPSDPPAGHTVMWMSDGTGAGDEGDLMLKINVGGVTKVVTLVDYSAA